MKKLIVIVVAVFAIASCRDKKTASFTVSGTITHAPSPKIFLQELPFTGDQPVILDSGSIKANGNFSLHATSKEEGLYRLVIEGGPDVLLVNDNSELKLSLESLNLSELVAKSVALTNMEAAKKKTKTPGQ